MFFQWVGKFNSKVHFFMVSKNQIKLITSLQQKKFRQIHQLFIAEGVKVIQELLQSNFVLEHLYVTQNIFETISSDKKTQISDQDLKRISCLSTPNNCLALFQIPEQKPRNDKGLIAVSYTHLDVYKRQEYRLPLVIKTASVIAFGRYFNLFSLYKNCLLYTSRCV